MHSPFISIVVSAAPLLVGVALNYAMNASPGGQRISDESMFLKMGVYAAEFIVLAVWLSWGPRTLMSRAAAASLLCVAWSLAAWAGLWVSTPDKFERLGNEKLQVFTVGLPSIILGALPLVLLRKRYRFVEPSDPKGRNDFLYVCSAFVLIVAGIAIALATYARGQDAWWDLLYLGVIGVVLGGIACGMGPLLASGLLRESTKPRLIALAPILAIGLAIIPSGLLAMPGPGAAGATSPKAPVILAALAASPCLIAAFWFWRSLGLRVVSETRNAEPGVGADSR